MGSCLRSRHERDRAYAGGRWPSVIEMKENAWETRNDEVARWLLGDNAAAGTARLLLLTLAYIMTSVFILNWLFR